MPENFSFPEVGKFLVTAVFENQCFAAVAHDNPIAMADFQFLQRASMFNSSAAPEQLRVGALYGRGVLAVTK